MLNLAALEPGIQKNGNTRAIEKVIIDLDSTASDAQKRTCEEHFIRLFDNPAEFLTVPIVHILGMLPEFIKTTTKKIDCETLILGYYKGKLSDALNVFIGFNKLALVGELECEALAEVIALPTIKHLDVQYLSDDSIKCLKSIFSGTKQMDVSISLAGYKLVEQEILTGLGIRDSQKVTVVSWDKDYKKSIRFQIHKIRDTISVEFDSTELISTFKKTVLGVKNVIIWQFVGKDGATTATLWPPTILSTFNATQKKKFDQLCVDETIMYLYQI